MTEQDIKALRRAANIIGAALQKLGERHQAGVLIDVVDDSIAALEDAISRSGATKPTAAPSASGR